MTIKHKIVEWYLNNIPKPEELDNKITATLDYVKRFSEPEDGEWTVYAYELIDGHHGQHITRMFLNEIDHDFLWGVAELEEVMDTFEEYSALLAAEFQKHSKLGGTFYIGNNEADGSLGVFYCVKD